ncbi:hypothetical protein BC828DRAFT_416462 [Blastocladiella britannica]|nr:hypothetical protein BC828DRAFT_416462 [Blastocladiella britannica]
MLPSRTTTSAAVVRRILASGAPSPRQAASYLRKYAPTPPPSAAVDAGTPWQWQQQQQNDTFDSALEGASTTGSPAAPAIPLALIVVDWPLAHPTAHAHLATDLATLHRVGVLPIVLLRPPTDPPPPSSLPDSGQVAMHWRSDIRAACNDIAAALVWAGVPARPVDAVFHIHDDGGESQNTEVDIGALHAPLAHGVVPVIAPLGTLWHASRIVPLSTAHAAVALCRPFYAFSDDHHGTEPTMTVTKADPESHHFLRRHCALTKLVLVNGARGGLPDPSTTKLAALSPLSMVNLAMDFERLNAALPSTARRDLVLTQRILAAMPPSASAVIAAAADSSAVVAHFLTDRPPTVADSASSTDPANAADPGAAVNNGDTSTRPLPPTIVRIGIPLSVHSPPFTGVDDTKLAALLESAFGRPLRADYMPRVRQLGHAIVVIGDYEGAAIVTAEPRLSDDSLPPLLYLDKFAVLPAAQSGGAADLLWAALRQVGRQYVLDDPKAVNGQRRAVVLWRSRTENKVNPWYFARADGVVKLEAAEPGAQLWTVFWMDLTDELPMSAVGAMAAAGESDEVQEWVEVVTRVPPSF